jgi:hypothetical protein
VSSTERITLYYSQEISRFAPLPWSSNLKCRCARSNIQVRGSVVATVNCYGRDYPYTSRTAPRPCTKGRESIFRGYSRRVVLTTHSFLALRLKMSRAIPLHSVSACLARNGNARSSILTEDFCTCSLLQSFLTKHITIHITRPRSLSSILLAPDFPYCAHLILANHTN